MRFKQILRRFFAGFDSRLEKFETFSLAFGVIMLAFITVGNAFATVVLKDSWPWINEISQFIIVLITFQGIGYAARNARHIRMTAFYDMFKPKIRKVLIIIISAVTALVLSYLALLSLRYVLEILNKESVTPNLRIPKWIMLIWIPIGFAVGTIHYILTIVKNIREKEHVWVSIVKTDDYDPEDVYHTNIDT